MRFRMSRCIEHPGQRGSLLCGECFERLRRRKPTMQEISDRALADVLAWPEWKMELWRRSQEAELFYAEQRKGETDEG